MSILIIGLFRVKKFASIIVSENFSLELLKVKKKISGLCATMLITVNGENFLICKEGFTFAVARHSHRS